MMYNIRAEMSLKVKEHSGEISITRNCFPKTPFMNFEKNGEKNGELHVFYDFLFL